MLHKPSEKKTLKKRSLIAAVGTVTAITTATAANALLPGSLPGLPGGYGSIYSPGSLSDIFGGGSIGGVFSDILGGTLPGGVTPGSTADCGGVLILNIDSGYTCGGGGSYGGTDVTGVIGDVLGGNPSSIFGTVFDVVAGELGLPGEIVDIITGKGRIEDILGGILNDALEDFGISVPTGSAGDVAGVLGIPDVEEIQRQQNEDAVNGTVDIRNRGIFTPNVISTLINPVLANNALATVTSSRVIGAEGQQLGEARRAASGTIVEASGKMGSDSIEMLKVQAEGIKVLDEETVKQTSTQDTLKTGLAGLNALALEGSKHDVMQTNQAALATRLAATELSVIEDISVSTAANTLGLKSLNEQAMRDSQQRLAENASLRYELKRGKIAFGAAR